ncbi:MAG: hypothetical protein AB1689_05550, partial [Thermodesulfobacteriota bacterium]
MRRVEPLLYNDAMAALPIPAAKSAPEDSSEHVACAVCGADDPVQLFEKHGFSIVRCRPCGFAYVDPRPAWSEVARIYRGESYYRNDNEY